MENEILAVVQVQDGYVVIYRGGQWEVADTESEEACRVTEIGNAMNQPAELERWLEEQPKALAAKVGGKVLWTWLRKAELEKLDRAMFGESAEKES